MWICLENAQGVRWAWDAAPHATLLASAAATGTPLRSTCRNGTCRACLCRLVEGRIRYLIEWPGVSAEERRDGWVLPCVAVPDID